MAESFGISAGDLGEHLSGGSKHSPKHFHTKARGLRADKYRIAPEGTLPPITSDSYPTRFADFLKDPTDSEAVAIVHYFDNAVSDTRPLFKAAIFDVVLPDRKGPVSVIDELLLATDTAPDLSAISAVMQGLKASAKKCIWGGKKSVCVLVDRRLKDAVLDAVRQGDAQRSAVLLDMTKQNEQGALDHAVLALQEGRRYGVPSLEDLGDASHVRSRSPDLQFPTAIRQRDCRLLKTVLDKMRPEQKRSEAFRVDLAKEMMIQVYMFR